MSVPNLLSDARSYTSTLTGEAASAMSDAIALVGTIGYSVPNVGPVALPSTPSPTVTLAPPVLTDIALDLPSVPSGTLVFQDISAIEAGAAPVLSAAAPTIQLPSKPAGLAGFGGSLPVLSLDVSFPDAPSIIVPDAPVLPTRVEPYSPQTLLPVFGGTLPEDTTMAPSDLTSSFNTAYRDAAPSVITMINGYVDAQLEKINPRYAEQMGAIEDQLAVYMAGGTGMRPEVEDAIYARAREKNDVEAARVRSAAYLEAASRGFTIPPGALLSAVARARQDAANNNVKAASDIVVMQAEMEQKNLQFAVTTSTGLRTAVLSATLTYMQNLAQLNGQALEYAKTVLSSIIEMYNTSVKMYSVKLEAYKAQAAVFETELKSAMVGIELYRQEVAALESMTQVDMSRVAVYKARIEALTSATAMYRTQVEAVVSKASLEKLKLELFQSQVAAFGAQVSAKNSEWMGYSSAIGGETAKAQIYGQQVAAYAQEVQGFRAAVEAKSEVVRAQALTNDARSRQYTAAMSGYQAVVQATGEVARTKLENQRQAVVAFQAESQAAVANAQVQNEYYKSTSMVAIENAKLRLSTQVQGAESQRAFGHSMATLGTANATIFANLAGAALSGMNTLSAETLASVA